jgi:hypothetical protein
MIQPGAGQFEFDSFPEQAVARSTEMSDDATKRTQKFQKLPTAQATRKPKITPPRKPKREVSQIAFAVVEKATGNRNKRW